MALSGYRDGLDEFDALAEARRAARRAGMSLGEWLDAVVDGRGTSTRPQHRPPPSEPAATADSIAAIRERIEAFARRHGQREADAPEQRLSRDTLRRLEERLDEIARRTQTMPVERTLPRAWHSGRESGATSRGRYEEPDRHNAAPPSTELKEAIAEIAARQRALEQEFDSSMASYTDRLDHRIDRVAERVERSIEEASPQSAIRGLEEELRSVAARLARDDREAPSSDLHGELSQLARRLDELPPRLAEDVAARLEDTARRIDTATRAEVDSIRAEMREIAQEIDAATRSGFEDVRAELATLLSRIDQRPSPAHGEAPLDAQARAEIAAIRDDIRALADQLDGAHRDGYAALRAELREIGGRMDCRAPERLQELERQLDTLIERIDVEPSGVGGTNFSAIERQIAGLAERFEATPDRLLELQHNLDRIADRLTDTPPASDRADLAEIERQIARLADRLDGDAAGGGDLEGLERRLGDLLRHLEDIHASDGSMTGLRDELVALKGNIDDANERSLTALTAVHDTLNRIVARLNALEAEVEEVASSRQPAAAPADYRADGFAADPYSNPEEEPEPESDPDDIIQRIEAVTRTFKSEIDDHTPLAPGSGRPDIGSVQDADAPAPATSREDFIAAARRAAQAAAAEQTGTIEQSPGRSATGPLLVRLQKYRRPLLIAAAAAILAFGGLKLVGMLTADAPVMGGAPTMENDTSAPSAELAAGPPPPADAPLPESRLESPRVVGSSPVPVPIITGSADGHSEAPRFERSPSTAAETDIAALPEPSLDVARAAPATIDLPPADVGSERLRHAAADGDPAAQFEVAARYTDGQGVTQDLDKAAHWYRLAAAQGLAPAQYRLGSLYEKGHGVPRDPSMARSWYQRAAERGNRTAMHNLAVLFAEGAEGEPDYEQAALWFRQSSEYGLKDSQYNLAVLYARGLGVEQNLAEAYRWFAAAAEQGDAEAAVQRDEVARRLDSDALAAAKLAAQSWQPKPLIEEANRVAAPDDGWDDDTTPAAIEPGDAVRQAQALLDGLGYEPGPIDGQAGALTRRAVIEFQRATGLPETGEVTPDLLDRLYQEAS